MQHPSSLLKSLATLAALLAVALCAAPAPAGGCGYYSGYGYGYTPYYYPSYPVYNNYEVKKYTVFETVPVYAVGVYAGYVAPPQAAPAATAPAPATPPAQETCETKLSAFRDRLLALEARLGAGAASSPGGYATPPTPPEKEYAPPRRERERPAEPPPMAPVTGGNGGGKYPTFAAKCLGCHAANVAKAKGGDHAFVTPLSPAGVNACLKEMMAGHMPPGSSKLTDQEFTIIMGELLGLPAGGAR